MKAAAVGVAPQRNALRGLPDPPVQDLGIRDKIRCKNLLADLRVQRLQTILIDLLIPLPPGRKGRSDGQASLSFVGGS